MSKEKKEVIKRVPLHKQNIFTALNREGFKRMWINELPGAIEAHELAGWKLVLDASMQTHESLSQVESQFDSVVRRVVNKSSLAPFRTAVLMEIPIELYEEDQRDQQKAIDDKMKKWTSVNKGEYGDVKVS